MTDSSMNFGPAWIRNLRSEGTSIAGGGTGGGSRYQLAEYRYGREEMLALFDKSVKPPPSLVPFKNLYSELALVPLALLPTTEEEQRGWQSRPAAVGGGAQRGRGGSLERGRINRGRGGYQTYGRATSAYDSGWGNGEQPDWSPRKDFATRTMDNWRRVRSGTEEDDAWRNIGAPAAAARVPQEKWGRSTSWRGDGEADERTGHSDRGGRANWHENHRGGASRRSWENEDHLPEWAMENPTEGGGTFDERGAFHGSDDEQEHRNEGKREMLQKSTSQQHISSKSNQNVLSASKSVASLTKMEERETYKEENKAHAEARLNEGATPERNKLKQTAPKKSDKRRNEESPPEDRNITPLDKISQSNGPSKNQLMDKTDEDFDRLQEDFVLKLVVDEETPKMAQAPSGYDVGGVQPPPNLAPPSQDKWYYQDPQGTRQGPFPNTEMAEWYKAGYFSNQLNVMRECDDRYFLLGELINLCGGDNPFLSILRLPTYKSETAKMPDDMLSYQLLSQLAFKQQVRNLAEPWSTLTLQQQELAAQRLLMQQQQQIPQHDLQFLQPSVPNPLLYMINQMQQNNKLPGPVMMEKPNNGVPSQLDPVLVQMHSFQNRMQAPDMHNPMAPAGLAPLPPVGLGNPVPGLPPQGIPPAALSAHPLHANMAPPRPPMEQLPQTQENDPLTNFLKQFQQQRQPPLEELWQKQNQFNIANKAPQQWPQPADPQLSMWDLQASQESQIPPPEGFNHQPPMEKEKEERAKEEVSQKELRKRKEQEEKQAKKEAEERRKREQKRQEADKKAAEEKKKKEEEKIKKELEKARKDAEEKRLKELEEKRRVKDARKAEEEARKKLEEIKKQEDEKIRREMKERVERKQQAESQRASQNSRTPAKSAPWSQSNSSQGVNLGDIQKAEKEKRAQETALLLQKQQLEEQQQQQQQLEKSGNLQLNWAKKPIETRKTKSFAEIQAEEQELLAKLAAEARLSAQIKEKETPIPTNSGNIWNGQTLSWANASSAAQWSTNTGFWDDVPTKSASKPSTVSKSNSTSAMSANNVKQQPKQSKTKAKKEEGPKPVSNNNPSKDEFTDWCYKTLSSISADIDIPTFVTFLRDIESAYDVRDYCKEYLGDSGATQQFASSFLERRRSFKPRNNAHKDDMCSPAPAITPSVQHSNEFQEVKGKNKKNKKSKMLKVDARILGFNVTSAPDRINVGDRDYGDNS